MSRERLEVRADQPAIGEAYIGWDRPLLTFFVQVYASRAGKDDDEDDDLVLWRGTSFREIEHAGTAIALVQPYAIVPSALAIALDAEKADTAAITDSPVQVAMKGLLFGGRP